MSMMNISLSADPLLTIKNVKQYFPVTAGFLRRQIGTVKAVNGVYFNILPQENLGLVGESGCGKTTLARTILRLYKPTEGEILFKNVDLATLNSSALRALRPKMQMIFQDPQDSLNPRMTVGSIIAEPIDEHRNLGREERSDRVEELLEAVGLDPRYTNRYPHEFSGGQRQRIGIARALSLNPEFIICDEPIAALDVSIQAQVVNLLEDLQEKLGLTYLFISHDLRMIRHISKRVAVMYLGKIVEIGPARELYTRAQHPYTKALLSAVPLHDPGHEAKRERAVLSGDVPSPANPPTGCPFRMRCPVVETRCAISMPEPREVSPNHWASCHLIE